MEPTATATKAAILLKEGKVDEFRALVAAWGDQRAILGAGLFHFAVGLKQPRAMAIVIDQLPIALANDLDTRGLTAVGYAVKSKSLEMAKQLLDAGANINLGRRPPGQLNRATVPLYLAVANPKKIDMEMVELLLSYPSLEVNGWDDFRPLHYSIVNKHFELFSALLHRADVQVNRVNDIGFSPLNLAITTQLPEFITLLGTRFDLITGTAPIIWLCNLYRSSDETSEFDVEDTTIMAVLDLPGIATPLNEEGGIEDDDLIDVMLTVAELKTLKRWIASRLIWGYDEAWAMGQLEWLATASLKQIEQRHPRPTNLFDRIPMFLDVTKRPAAAPLLDLMMSYLRNPRRTRWLCRAETRGIPASLTLMRSQSRRKIVQRPLILSSKQSSPLSAAVQRVSKLSSSDARRKVALVTIRDEFDNNKVEFLPLLHRIASTEAKLLEEALKACPQQNPNLVFTEATPLGLYINSVQPLNKTVLLHPSFNINTPVLSGLRPLGAAGMINKQDIMEFLLKERADLRLKGASTPHPQSDILIAWTKDKVRAGTLKALLAHPSFNPNLQFTSVGHPTFFMETARHQKLVTAFEAILARPDTITVFAIEEFDHQLNLLMKNDILSLVLTTFTEEVPAHAYSVLKRKSFVPVPRTPAGHHRFIWFTLRHRLGMATFMSYWIASGKTTFFNEDHPYDEQEPLVHHTNAGFVQAVQALPEGELSVLLNDYIRRPHALREEFRERYQVQETEEGLFISWT